MEVGELNTVMEESSKKLDEEIYICVDTSGSTGGCKVYYDRVHDVINKSTQRYKTVKIISWNSSAKYCKEEDLSPNSARGGTNPSTFLPFIKDLAGKYHLIVTTDGEIWEEEMKRCREDVLKSNILNMILSIRVYYIGNIEQMNLMLSDVFGCVKDKKIIINDEDPIQIIDIDVDKLSYDDFVNNHNIVASVLELIKTRPDQKDELRVQLCRANNRILAELAKNNTIKQFYEKDDVEGCINFVKYMDPTNKTKFQQVMSKLIQICTDKNMDLYSLSHLLTSKTLHNTNIPVEFDENALEEEDKHNHAEENEDYITCDITLIKSNNPCAEIVLLGNDEDNILSDEESKLISQNPWLILNNESIIKKVVKHVGHYTYDLITKNRMDDAYTHYLSAFTRQQIYGVFVFHRNNGNIDYDLVFKNNSRAISFIFNKKYKLPGNKSIWNILFLYILGKHHPHWKQHSKMIHEEILNILPRLSTFITLSPLLNPPIIDSLDAALWYIMKVSYRAFPNSSKNILRSVEAPERLFEIYDFIYPDSDISDLKFKVKVWNVWKYLVRNKSSKSLKLEVISQYQNHELIDGNIVLLSGKSEKQSIDLKPLHTHNLYHYLLTKPNATLFERIPFENLDNGEVVPTEGVNDSLDQLHHIKLCLTTCRPLYACPVTKVVWKECADKFNVKKESFFRAFIRFCEKHKRYPENVDEFLVNHSNQFNFGNEAGDHIVYGKDIKVCLGAVMNKFSDIVKKYSVKDFIWTYNKNCEIDNRTKNEKKCSCGVH